MVDRDVFQRRLARLEELLALLRRLAEVPEKQYLSDQGLQAQAERWLHLASECALDLAHHLIADRGWRQPDSYRDAMEILEEHGLLGAELSERMRGWAGLRNVLVHLYLEVDQARIREILMSDLDDLESFAGAVSSFLDED